MQTPTPTPNEQHDHLEPTPKTHDQNPAESKTANEWLQESHERMAENDPVGAWLAWEMSKEDD